MWSHLSALTSMEMMGYLLHTRMQAEATSAML